MNVAVLSIAFDSLDEQAQAASEYGIDRVPMLSDADHRVSEAYGVLQWAVRTGEPGHTFILIKADGTIGWIRDYGVPRNGGSMVVPVEELVAQIRENL